MSSFTAASRAAAAGLELTVLRRLDGLLQGDHVGLLPGHGSETGEARLYEPGDDTRRLDWALTARTTAPHVRDTISDHELELWLVVDDSASLAFGTARCEKHDVAWAAAGAFALLASRGGNRVGAITASGARLDPRSAARVQGGPRSAARAQGGPLSAARASEPPRSTGRVRAAFPARSGRPHVGAIIAALRRPPQEGVTADLAAALTTLRRHARRRGLVVVVSDFLVPDGWEGPLRALAARHDVVAVEVIDPRELALPDVGSLALVDPESGRRRVVDTGDAALRDRYAEAAQARRADVARRISAAGAHHLVLRTDRDWVVDLVRFVSGRRRQRTAASGGRR